MLRSTLAFLAVIGVLVGCDSREAPPPYGKPTTTDGKAVEQAMVKDPVCGMMVDSKKAKDHTYKDVKYYFCSQACHDTFEKNPEKYALPNPPK